MSKKGENIYKRKDGRWEGRYIKLYNEEGKAKYGYLYGKTYGEVKNKLKQKHASFDQAELSRSCKTVLYSEIITDWLQSTRIHVKESTYVCYKQLIDRHIIPPLGKYAVNKISTQLVERMIEGKIKNGRLDGKGGLAPKTVTDIITIVKSSMEYAVYNGFPIVCNLSKLSVKKGKKEMRVLTTQEQKKLTLTILENMDLCKLGVLISLYTGIRIGELCALKWENLDLNDKTLKIRKTMQRIQNFDQLESAKTKIIITEPKSRCSIRDIPIHDFLLNMLYKFQGMPNEFVLTGEKDRFIEPRTMQNCFKRYIKECGLNEANYHALRHTFATRCVEAGFEIKSLSEILGHANVNITLNQYVHSSFDLKSENINKLTIVA